MSRTTTKSDEQKRSFGRSLLLLAMDLAFWVAMVAIYLGDEVARPILVVSSAPLIFTVAGLITGVHNGRYRVGSFEEFGAVAVTVGLAIVGAFAVGGATFDATSLRRVVALAATTLMATTLPRYGFRLWNERLSFHDHDATRYLIFGAGEGGAMAVRMMLRDADGRNVPVALLDDDQDKRQLRIMGIPVVGTRADVVRSAHKYHADVLLIAAGRADAATIGELVDAAVIAKLKVKVLPRFDELFDNETGPDGFRQLNEADLLGRHRVETDVAKIADYLRGHRVLVTGAGGSIGSELCRQIARFEPSDLVMVDRDESSLHAVQLSITGSALLQDDGIELLDLRDAAAVQAMMARRRPEVIFHAAALKHLPLLERYPAEAVKTNVWSTNTLLEIAVQHGVTRFVNISTDKAADPCSVLGYSKRLTERLTSWWAKRTDSQFMSVRFGNVLMSRGSVITTFQRQLRNGGPITVTHPDVERYFMTVEEAVELTIQAGAIGRPAEVLVLDMGAPVRIADVAQRLVAMAAQRIEIVFTGLRPGEKLTEDLLGHAETDVRPMHPLISQVAVPSLNPELIVDLPIEGDIELIIAALARVSMAPEDASAFQVLA